MRRYRQIGRVWKCFPQARSVSEYAPLPPSPNDLKDPLPEKYSVGKNLKLKAVLFEYDLLATSRSRDSAPVNKSVPKQASVVAVEARRGTPASSSKSYLNLASEVSGLLGKARRAMSFEGDDMNGAKTVSTYLKEEAGKTGLQQHRTSAKPTTRSPPRLSPAVSEQGKDPRAKYMSRIFEKTGKMGSTAPTPVFAAGDAELLMSGKERVGQSAWMLREGVGEILLYLATRSVHIGVIASPQTTPIEFDNFIEQLRIQSTRIRATISPLTVSEEGMETGLAKAYADLDVKRTSAVLVVGSTEAILCAANAAEMFTARYNSPNSMREGVIQSFTVRHINEIRTVVEQLNGVSYR